MVTNQSCFVLFRFQVKYTVTNTERDDGNVLLVWSPFNNGSTTTHNISATEQSLVCLQPKVRIGYEKIAMQLLKNY